MSPLRTWPSVHVLLVWMGMTMGMDAHGVFLLCKNPTRGEALTHDLDKISFKWLEGKRISQLWCTSIVINCKLKKIENR